eukprot:gene4402-16605_t
MFELEWPMLVMMPAAKAIPQGYEHLCNLVHRGPRDDGHCVAERPTGKGKQWERVDSLHPERPEKVKGRRVRRAADRVWRVLRKPKAELLDLAGDPLRLAAIALGKPESDANSQTEIELRHWMQAALRPYYDSSAKSTAEPQAGQTNETEQKEAKGGDNTPTTT